MVKLDQHIFSGMQRDSSRSKHKGEFLTDARNIRITQRGDDTLLSITNERGPKYLTGLDLAGTYLGHCCLENFVIVFTVNSTTGYIYKLDFSDPEHPAQDTLYEGSLGFDAAHKIEALGVYENDNIKKVYWTDGLNQPRVINICNTYYDIVSNSRSYKDPSIFDFVANLDLNEVITVDRIDGSGMFAPGVIQYAFSYYNKYGRQSNIFYTTRLLYTSFVDRGGSPEDKVANSFRITIENVDYGKFDYLRIYSIQRTSLNTTPMCKLVTDIDLSTIGSGDSITFVDNGEKGEAIDPNELLYLGGETVIAGTMEQKDNTLFLGNLTMTRHSIPSAVKTHFGSIDVADIESVAERMPDLYYKMLNQYYHTFTLYDRTPGFKLREHYRLGVQFQHKSGKWSEPVFINDFTTSITNNERSYWDKIIIRIEDAVDHTQNSSIIQSLLNEGYVKYRPVCTFPTVLDRLVLTQGILCPTVFNLVDRDNGTPFAQSSWFFRPFQVSTSDNNLLKVPEYRHNHILGTMLNLNAEVQGQPEIPSGETTTPYNYVRGGSVTNVYHTGVTFAVDNSILTMHSPEIEFDDYFANLSDVNYKLRIVGVAQMSANIGAMTLSTSSPSISGFTFKNPKFFGKEFGSGATVGQTLMANFTYNDDYINPESDKYETALDGNNGKIRYMYVLYPWHKSGSLNNDVVRSADGGAQTAILKTKKLSNLKFFGDNKFLHTPVDLNIGKIQLFNSDQVTLMKVPYIDRPGSPDKTKVVSYYGNVDTMVSNSGIQSVVYDSGGSGRSQVGGLAGNSPSNTSVRIKYKSTPHLVFALNGDETHIVETLPYIGTGTYNSVSTPTGQEVPFWFPQSSGSSSSTLINVAAFIPQATAAQIGTNQDSGYTDLKNAYFNADHVGNTAIIVKSPDTSIAPYALYKIMSGGQQDQNIFILDPDHNSSGKTYVYTKYNAEHGRWDRTFFSGDSGYLSIFTPSSDPGNPVLPYSEFHRCLTDNLNNDITGISLPYMYIAELYRDADPDNDFAGTSDYSKGFNLWCPAGEPEDLDINESITLNYIYGDTWYQRYDCLKTYPFTQEDENSIIEIGSFLCETRVNLDGRYDRNRGALNNTVMSPINFNLLNPVYSQGNNFFNYRMLDPDYYVLNKFKNVITWSKMKSMASTIDPWTNINLASTLDLDGDFGAITKLVNFNNNLFCFQDNAFSNILYNSRTQIATSESTPIEIANSGKVDGKVYISNTIGTKNKDSIVVTDGGIYFIDTDNNILYNYAGEKPQDVSTIHGMSAWFDKQDNTKAKCFYDTKYKDLYITYDYSTGNDECIVFSGILGQFTSFMDYGSVSTMFNSNGNFYSLYPNAGQKIYEMFAGDYNNFFGTPKPYYLEFISNPDPTEDKIFGNIDVRADFYSIPTGGTDYTLNSDLFFNTIRVSNEYQDTGTKTLTKSMVSPSPVKKKFRIWHIDIPRDNGKIDRIRNLWAKINLTGSNTNHKMELHDLAVKYYI